MLQDDLKYKKPGRHGADLMQDLGPLLWQHQQIPARLLISSRQYYWWLPCRKHLRLVSVQAVVRQHKKLPGGLWELATCERCSCDYKTGGPEPNQQGKGTSSMFAQACWKHMEWVLDAPHVLLQMQLNTDFPTNLLVGADLGYVLEARVVAGWNGGVDVYVPGLKLAVQVDGQHHDGKEQQATDLKFMQVAHQQQLHVLRLWYADLRSMPQDVYNMVHDCIAHVGTGKPAIVRCSKAHPLCTDPWYISVNM